MIPVPMRFLLVAVLMASTSLELANSEEGNSAMHRARGTFEVKMKPEPLSEVAAKSSIARMSIDKAFHGELEGTSQGEFLASGSPDGSGAYVAMERVTGEVNGKFGSFVLQHAATMVNKVPTMSVTIVPGSGSGELAGVQGSMQILVEAGQHSYDLSYEIGN